MSGGLETGGFDPSMPLAHTDSGLEDLSKSERRGMQFIGTLHALVLIAGDKAKREKLLGSDRKDHSEIRMLVSRVIESWSPYLQQEPPSVEPSSTKSPLPLIKGDPERLLALRQLLEGDYIEEIYNGTVERGGDAVQYGVMLQVLDIRVEHRSSADGMLVR
jgi:hypothetical protein